MRRFRWLPVTTRCLLVLVQAAPLVALFLAVVVDRGPEAEARLSSHLLPLVLWIFDDFAWTCARNSLVFALVVSLASLVLGAGLRSEISRLRSWRRSSLATAALAVLAVSPAFMALGLTGLLGPAHGWPWPIWASDPTNPGTSLESWRGLPVFVVWVWACLPAAVAWVWLAADPAFEQLEPSWAATARVAGSGSFRIVRDLTWPVIRPAAVRAAGQVFAFSLFEPGASLILGLRRTLAYQIVDAAGQPEPFPRAAAWTVMTALFGLGGWALFRWRGGNPILGAPTGFTAPGSKTAAGFRTNSPSAWRATLVLTAWAAIAWLPVFGLTRLALGSQRRDDASGDSSLGALLGRLRSFGESPAAELALNSLIFGLAVASGITLISWLVPPARPTPSRRSQWRRLFRPRFQMPALVPGIALMAFSYVAALVSTLLLERGWSNTGLVLENLATALDAQQTTWVPMACGVGLFLLPWFLLSRQAGVDASRHSGIDSAFDAALLAGARRWRARMLAAPDRPVRDLVRFIVVAVFAATNVTPALLFLSSESPLTVGPGILIMAGQNGDGPTWAAALAVCAVVVNAATLALAKITSVIPRTVANH
jgi:ABC-type Fe3+ transport system permease subunit